MTDSPTPNHRGRRAARLTIAALLLLGSLACRSSSSDDDADGWVVERTTTEDGATLVRNVSGSKWGGNATLVEELSIGVMEGEEAYMLAQPGHVWVTDDEIYVLDWQDSIVKVFDRAGVFLRKIGRPGSGPGEIGSPSTLVVAKDGRVLVAAGSPEGGSPKIVVFTASGEVVEEWRTGTRPAFELVETPRGLFKRASIVPEDPSASFFRREGFQELGPDGPVGEIEEVPDYGFEPVTIDVATQGFSFRYPVPLAPRGVISVMLPSGHVVHGYPDAYRITIAAADGSRTIAERVTDAVPISSDQADNARRSVVASLRRQIPDFDWDGAELPDTQPWFQRFLADHSGRFWVSRLGPARRVEDCVEPEDQQPGERPRPCWAPERLLEVFDVEGNYLGAVDRPTATSFSNAFVNGDLFAAPTEDEDGTPVVKVYRIVLPSTADTDS